MTHPQPASAVLEFTNDGLGRILSVNQLIPKLQQHLVEWQKKAIELQQLIAAGEETLNQFLSIQRDTTYLQQVFENMRAFVAQKNNEEMLAKSEPPNTPAAVAGRQQVSIKLDPNDPNPQRTIERAVAGLSAEASMIPGFNEGLKSNSPTREFVIDATGATAFRPPQVPTGNNSTLEDSLSKLRETTQALQKRAPAASAPHHPTQEAPSLGLPTDHKPAASANSGPTEEVAETAAEAPKPPSRDLLMIAVTGPRSVWVKYLSPEVVQGGQGFVAPGFGLMKQYTQDVTTMTPDQLSKWPGGFYRSSTTNDRQLFLNLHGVLIVVDNVKNPACVPLVSIPNRNNGNWEALSAMADHPMTVVLDLIIKYFRSIAADKPQQ